MSSQVFDSQNQLLVEEILLSKVTYYVVFHRSFIFGADAALTEQYAQIISSLLPIYLHIAYFLTSDDNSLK